VLWYSPELLYLMCVALFMAVLRALAHLLGG